MSSKQKIAIGEDYNITLFSAAIIVFCFSLYVFFTFYEIVPQKEIVRLCAVTTGFEYENGYYEASKGFYCIQQLAYVKSPLCDHYAREGVNVTYCAHYNGG